MTFLNSVTASENCLSMKLVSVTDIEMEYRLKQQLFRFSVNELKFTVQNYIFH